MKAFRWILPSWVSLFVLRDRNAPRVSIVPGGFREVVEKREVQNTDRLAQVLARRHIGEAPDALRREVDILTTDMEEKGRREMCSAGPRRKAG